MKIIINKEIINPIINNLESLLDKDKNSSINENIYLKIEKDILIFKATNREIGIELKVTDFTLEDQDDEHELLITRSMIDLIKILSEGNIIFNIKKDKIFIKQNKITANYNKYKLYNMDETERNISHDFDIPEFNEVNEIKLDLKNMAESLKKIRPSIGGQTLSIEYQNAFIDIREYEINFVASDMKRLEKISFESQAANNFSFLLPKKAISEIEKFFSSKEQQANIYYEDAIIFIKDATKTLFIKTPNAKFPNYTEIIPKNIDQKIYISKSEILKMIKTHISARELSLTFNFNKEGLRLETKNIEKEIEIITDRNELDQEKNIKFFEFIGDDDFTLSFNINYIKDFLENIDTEYFSIEFNKENKDKIIAFKSDNFSMFMMQLIK